MKCQCPSCKFEYEIPAASAGKSVRCGKCHTRFVAETQDVVDFNDILSASPPSVLSAPANPASKTTGFSVPTVIARATVVMSAVFFCVSIAGATSYVQTLRSTAEYIAILPIQAELVNPNLTSAGRVQVEGRMEKAREEARSGYFWTWCGMIIAGALTSCVAASVGLIAESAVSRGRKSSLDT